MDFSFDPRGLLGRAVDAARLGINVYDWAEEQVVTALRTGLDAYFNRLEKSSKDR